MKNQFLTISIMVAFFSAFGAPADAQQATSPLTLERAVTAYIERNLELQAERYRLERTKADAIAARLRPNPGLSVTVENLRVSGPTSFDRLNEYGVAYSETIELGGKRKLREQVAAVTISAGEARVANAMRKGIAEVKRLYFQAVLARRDIEVAIENRQMFQQLVQFNLARFQEGAIPEADLIKVRLERIKFDSALKQAELRERQAMIQLAENLEDDAIARQVVAGEVDLRILNPDLDTLLETALRERPDVQAAQREVEAAKEKIALEEARARADISPFVGYKR